ncbi:MAG TPA: carboxypeptidase regulatory-like domain-containing protein, partial [Bryobacteraceae bacterium]|nr:carboxypeptidase regulatory-like domain-containing protein [Bryobacteraceae bacterium]
MKHIHTAVPRLWSSVAHLQRGIVHSAVFSLLLLLAAGAIATAQERFGEISGTAMDSTGAVLPGVKVVVANKTTGRTFETTTGASGAYQARNLEPGHYSVRFELKGFTTYEVGDVNLLLGKTFTVDAKMAVGSTEQAIQVTDAAPLIDTTNTTMANNITAEEFDRLPKARSFQSLALASTSTNSGEIEGGIQVNGASGAENNFTIDGISTNSLLNGQSRQDAVFEILQEVQVKTGGISAEYGGALGGVVSAVTSPAVTASTAIFTTTSRAALSAQPTASACCSARATTL